MYASHVAEVHRGTKGTPGYPSESQIWNKIPISSKFTPNASGHPGYPSGQPKAPGVPAGRPAGSQIWNKIPNCPKVHQMYLVSQAPQGTQRYTGYPSGNPSGVHKVPAGFGNKIIFVPNLEKYPCSEFGTHCKNTAPHCTAGGIVTCSV